MFVNKNVLIIGSRGMIGLEIFKSFLSEGAFVIGTVSNEINIQEIKNDLINYCDKFDLFELDLKNKNNISDALTLIIEKYKKIDILIYNSGITKDSIAIKMKKEEWTDVIDINLTSCFFVNQFILKHMIKNKKGKIINISSIVGIIGNAGQANYSASKAGMVAMSKSLALEYGSRGININCIAPGFIETKMTEALSQEVRDKMLSRIPLGKYGNAKDIANAALFLASEKSDYITGETININGGMFMK